MSGKPKYNVARKEIIDLIQGRRSILVDMLETGSRDFDLLTSLVGEYVDLLSACDALGELSDALKAEKAP